MSNQTKNNEEEIEVGSLFVVLGNGIKKLFRFIGKIFFIVFDFLIQILLFLKKHFVKIGVAAIIGGLIGLFLELKKEQHYGSDMLVQPNFESARQLYNNIEYYNDLVKQKDSVLLSKTFSISKADAATLKKFSITPIENENDIIKSYDDLILEIDTTSIKSYSFLQFKRAFTNYDYKNHLIHVEATKKNVFGGLDDVILASVTKNKHFNKVKNLTNENLNRTDSLLRKNLVQTDSLLGIYQKVMIERAKKENASTSIDLGNKNSESNELEVFKTKRTINNDLKEISEEKSEKSEVINVISNLQPVGYEVKGLTKNYIFQFALFAILGVILFLLMQQLNRYLENYKK